MVAIVSGNNLGLSLSSLATLGQRGVIGSSAQGRSGEQSFVNIANGNLVLQDRDDVLVGRGPDLIALRTYNSQGLPSDNNWTVGAFGQRIALAGTVATAGSTLTRTDRDGAQAVYAWDVFKNIYVSTAGAGAFDTVAYDASTARFIWTDGDSGLVERYQSTGDCRLLSVTDCNGNVVSYTYNANGTVQSATDANGEVSYYDYNGENLIQIRTVLADGRLVTRVRYAYDDANRLSRVTVDLSLEDNSVADGKTYVTTYAYDGASKRVAGVTQSDGTSLDIAYVQSGGGYKVASITDALGGVTRFSYDIAQGATTVTDALGAKSVYRYDTQGQLVQVRQGVTTANPAGLAQISYRYDFQGNVVGLIDGEGREVVYEYDANGNLLKEIDSAGNTRLRTYNAGNQLSSDTLHADAAISRGAFSKEASLPETTRYVHAQGNPLQLRFVIDAEGNVTEYRYDAYGQRTAIIRYAEGRFDTAALSRTQVPTQAQMMAWQQTQNLSRSERTDYAYDARGSLISATNYGEIDASGAGVAATAARTQYVHDQRGLLLQEIDSAGRGTTSYVLDGLGRVLSMTAPSLDGIAPNTTLTNYDDAGGKTTMTLAGGLASVSAHDKAGRLVSVMQTVIGTGILGTTRYAYDKDGNLLMTQDPTGLHKWTLYDEVDRKIADIDAAGALIEYVYNTNGQLRQTISYARKLSAAQLALLTDEAGQPTTSWSASNTKSHLAALRPSSTAEDQKLWRFYDSAGRLAWQVDALGYVTQTTYDGVSRVLSVTRLARPVDVTPLMQGTDIDIGIDPDSLGGVELDVGDASMIKGHAVELKVKISSPRPDGTVIFFDGETIIGTAAVIDGKASLVSDRLLALGTHELRAAYSGDIWLPASFSKTSKKTVTPPTPDMRIDIYHQDGDTRNSSNGKDQVAFGDAVTLSASLTTSRWPDLKAASGVVKFYAGNTFIGESVTVNGMALLTVSDLPVGRSVIRAEYAGDHLHGATVQTTHLQVLPRPTTLKLKTEWMNGGSSALLTAVVSNGGKPPPPSGTVTFRNADGPIGQAQLIDGVATLIKPRPTLIDYLNFNPRVFRAYFDGDATNGSSASERELWPTSISLSASSFNDTQGPVVELIAQVDGAELQGQVAFFAGKTYLGTAVPDQGGRAVLYGRNMPAGQALQLHAIYEGDNGNKTSTSSVSFQQTKTGFGGISALPSLRLSEWDREFGRPIRVQLSDGQYDPSTRSYPYAGGRFTVFDGDKLIGNFEHGGGTLVLPPMSVGVHNLTVVFSGNQKIAARSGTLTLNIRSASADLRIGSSAPMAVQGQSVTFTAVIDHPAATSANGIVTFHGYGSVLGTALMQDGVARLTLTNLPLGDTVVRATYSGNDNFRERES